VRDHRGFFFMDDTFILIVGSPFDGMHFYGPFESHDDAAEYGEANFDGDTWWVTLLNPIEITE
jgi:hypothetical protein